MASEQGPHLPAFAFHQEKALGRSQRSEIFQLKVDLAVFVRDLEEENPVRFFPVIHDIIIPRRKLASIFNANWAGR
jgi:hypothetical protein